MKQINDKTSVILSIIGRIILVVLLASICVYWVISRANCGSNEGDDVTICVGMLTICTTIPFIILTAAFFLVRNFPIVVGSILLCIGPLLVIPYTHLFFFPMAFITDGLLFIISGLIEERGRKVDEQQYSLPERPAESSSLIKPAGVKPLWSTRKKAIFISFAVLLVLASTVTIDLIRYNHRLESAIAYFYRGLAYAGEGDFANAVLEYNQAVQLKPRFTEAYYYRGVAYLYLSMDAPHISDAIDDFDRVIQLDPNYAMAYYYRGIVHVYGDNISLNSRSIITYIRDSAKNAISDISKYLQLNPIDAKAYNFRGLAYFNIGDLDNAICDFDQAIQLNPDFAIAYNNRGLAHARKTNLDRAISDYDEAIHLKPDFAAAYYNRGQAFYDKGNLDLAISDWEQAIWIKPYRAIFFNRGYIYYDKSEVYYNLGLAYYNKGELDLAINEFDQAIQDRPGFELANYYRGLAYYNKGMYNQALSDFEHGQPDYPDDIQFIFHKGLLYYYAGYPAGAIESFYGVLTRNPDFSTLYEDWRNTFGGEGYLDRVINDFDKAIRLYPDDPQTYFFRGLTYSIKGETENAIADLKIVLKLCSTNALTCKEAQRALQKLGGQ